MEIKLPELTELVNELRLLREAVERMSVPEPIKRAKTKKEPVIVEAPVVLETAPEVAVVEPTVEAPVVEPTVEAPVVEAPPTISEVREFLAGLMSAGKQPEVKALFAEMGVARLGEIAPERYTELMELAGKI